MILHKHIVRSLKRRFFLLEPGVLRREVGGLDVSTVRWWGLGGARRGEGGGCCYAWEILGEEQLSAVCLTMNEGGGDVSTSARPGSLLTV